MRYAGADEWYAVAGSPIVPDVGGQSPTKLRGLHERVVWHLKRLGRVVDGNEEPASL